MHPNGFSGGRLRSAASLLAIAGCAAMLAGCVTTQSDIVTGATPMSYRERHPIVLKEGPRTVDLFIGDRRGDLTGTQRAEVLAFANDWRREASGGILIDVPSGTSNARAAASAAQEARAILVASGVPADAIALRRQQSRDPSKMATLRLHYPRVMADVGPCGLWPHDLGATSDLEHNENRAYWNLGCASQRNLAAMVENPADLVQPRAEGPAYTGRRSTVLGKYGRGESTATIYPDQGKDKISDLGQ